MNTVKAAMRGGVRGMAVALVALAAVIGVQRADAYILYPTSAKEARVVFGGNEDASNYVTQSGTTQVDSVYNVTTNYSGITLNFDDFGSGPVEYVDLNAFTNHQYGVGGDPDSIKVEYVDTSDRKAVVNLIGVTAGVQTYDIAKTTLQAANPLCNLARIRFINFIVDAGLAGSGNESGSFTVRVDGGLPPAPYQITPSGSGTITQLPGSPVADEVGGSNPQTLVTTLSSSNILISYGLGSNDFGGATILFDDFGTSTNEYQNLAALGGSVVFGVYGAPAKAKIEVQDIFTNSVSATLLSVSGSLQYYALDLNTVSNSGVNPTRVRFVNFVLDQGLAGLPAATGTLNVVSGGLRYDTNVILSLTGTVSGAVTVLPNEPGVILVGGGNGNTTIIHTNSSLTEIQYNVVTNFSGMTILYDNFGTPSTNESQDLSGFTSLVFAVYGDPDKVKLELIDSANRLFVATLANVAGTPLYFNLPTSRVTNNLAQISQINFVIDANLVGSANTVGVFYVESAGLSYDIFIERQTNGTISTLPGEPPVVKIGGGNDASTTLAHLSTNEFYVIYDVTTNFAGASILFDNFGTPETNEYQDLSSILPLTFAITGSANNIGIEIEDIFSNKMSATLEGTDTFQPPPPTGAAPTVVYYYTVEAGHLAARGVNSSRVRFINFVVDVNKAGEAQGVFDVRIGGLAFPTLEVSGTSTGTLIQLPGSPTPITLPGGTGTTAFNHLSTQQFSVAYSVTATNFAGGMILFDNFGTPATNESQNLSAFTHLVFGLTGMSETVAFEIEDIYTNKASASLLGTQTGTLQYFAIPSAALVERGVDLSQVRFINFVVDLARAGAGNPGTFGVYANGLARPDLQVSGTSTGTLTQLPGSPTPITLPGGQGTTSFAHLSTQQFSVGYALNATNFAGGMILFDNFGTAATNESQNLSTNAYLVFGVTGSPANINFEIEDIYTNKAVAALLGTKTNALTYFAIPSTELSARGVDLTQVRFMGFVVDSNRAGAANLTGSFGVYARGLAFPEIMVSGTSTGTLTQLPGRPAAITLPGGEGTTAFTHLSTQQFSVGYALNATNFAGGTILFDNFGTGTTNEYQDLSANAFLVFGVTGSPATVNFEIEDIFTNKAVATLQGAQSPTIQYFAIPVAELTARGVVVSRVRFMNFVIDSNRAGAANLVGSFGVYAGALAFPDLVVAGAPTGTLTHLPGLPEAITLPGGEATTLFTHLSTQQFAVAYALNATNFAGGTILFDNFGTAATNEYQDLSTNVYLVFAATGSPRSATFEIEDIFTNKTSATLLPPAETEVRVVFGGNEDASNFVTTVSNSQVLDTYNVTTNYSGITLNFDDFGTLPLEYVDLDSLATHTFHLAGTPNSVKLEYVDTTDQKAEVPLAGVSGTTQAFNVARSSILAANPQIKLSRIRFINFVVDATLAGGGNQVGTFSVRLGSSLPINLGQLGTAPQYYAVPSAELVARGVNLARVRFMNFVVDSNRAGVANLTGAFGVYAAGLRLPPYQVGSSPTGTVTVLPGNNTSGSLGNPTAFGSTNIPNPSLTRPTADVFSLTYNVCSNGTFQGVFMGYDEFLSASNEYINLSGQAQFIVRVRGTTPSLKVEFSDTLLGVGSATLTGVTTNWQYYTIDLAQIALQGANLAEIDVVAFVVDGTLSGGNCSGSFDVQLGGLYFELTIGPGEGPQTLLPNAPTLTLLGPGASDLVNTNTTLVSFKYDVTPLTNFAAVSILYDNYGTATTNENYDLSAFTNIVFGLYGHASSAQIQFQDYLERTMRVNVTNIASTTRYFRIDTTVFTNDISRMSRIHVIVEHAKLPASQWTGRMQVVSGYFPQPIYVFASGTGPVSTLPPTPVVDLAPNSHGGTSFSVTDTNRIFLDYNITTGGLSGVTIRYDDPGTGPVETGDFSNLTNLTFALRGGPENAKFELADANGLILRGVLVGVSSVADQYYTLNIADLQSRGLDVTKVRYFNIYEDLEAAGLDNLDDTLAILVGGLTFSGNGPTDILPTTDTNGNGLSDTWESLYGLGPGNNGAHDDPDGDGYDNEEEFNAGSNPMSGSSYSEVIVTRTGTTFYISMDGFSQRRYQLECRTSLVTGTWAPIGSPTQLLVNTALSRVETAATDQNRYYRYLVSPLGASPMLGDIGRPEIRVVFGGNEGGTVMTTNSTREIVVQYDVSTGGYSGITFNFDNFGTGPIESMDISDYQFVTFALSGTPNRIKYEFHDAQTNLVSGVLLGVTNFYKSYAIPTSMLASNGLNLAEVRFINFVVDGALAGPGNEAGRFGLRTFGLNYTIQPAGQGSGSATVLPTPAPRVDNLGGANSANTWTQNGTTNVVMTYNVTGGGYDGFIIRYEDFVTPGVQSGDLGSLGSVTLGISGNPSSVKVEFIDDTNYRVDTFVTGITGTTKWYTFSLQALQDLGVDVRHLQFINFVVDQGLAGGGNHSGSINVVTGGLAP